MLRKTNFNSVCVTKVSICYRNFFQIKRNYIHRLYTQHHSDPYRYVFCDREHVKVVSLVVGEVLAQFTICRKGCLNRKP